MALDLFQSDLQTSTTRGLSVRPTQEMVVIKHDSRVGAVSLIIPDNDPNDRKSRGSVIDVNEVEFVPLTMVSMAKGENIQSNASFADAFDVYKYNDRGQSTSLGIFDRNGAYEAVGTSSSYRIVGVLRSVNGAGISTLDNALSEKFGSNPVPAYLDLTYAKLKQLDSIDPNHGAGSIVKLTTGKNRDLVQVTTRATYFLPLFEVTEMDKKTSDKFEAYITDFLVEVQTWIDAIRENDKKLVELKNHGLARPNVVNDLRKIGIDSYDDLATRVKELGGDNASLGFKALAEQLVGDGVEADTSADTDELVETKSKSTQADEKADIDPFNQKTPEDKSANDDLPF